MSEKSVRSIGKAVINVGLVSCPIKLYSATDTSSKISFHFLHRGCKSRVRQQYICERENIVIERNDMDRGYEYGKDLYVSFTTDELRALEEPASYSINVEEFVPLNTIDPLYLDKCFYLAPERGSSKAYSLLVEALKRSNKAGVGRYASRGKDYTVMLRVIDNCIIMQTLLYSAEVKSHKDIPLDPIDVRDAELDLALRLIDSLSHTTFDAGKYKDSVKERVEEAIKDKINGKQITIQPQKKEAVVTDLLEALRASLKISGERASL